MYADLWYTVRICHYNLVVCEQKYINVFYFLKLKLFAGICEA